MVESLGWAELEVRPKFSSSFGTDLDRGVSGHLVSAGTLGGRKYGDAAGRSMATAFSAHAKTAALAASAGFVAAGAALFKIGKDSIAEARESQKVGALTEQVIKSTGQSAHVTAQQVGNLSTAISLKTGIDDEAIQSGANMLLTFKDIRDEVGKGNDIFDQSTKIITDMSAAMAGGKGGDIDLKASAIQVGKALNDPVKGVTALAKVGVTFTNQQRAQIKALVEGGDANAAMALGLIDSTTTYNNLLKANGGNAQAVADILTRDLNPAQKKSFDLYTQGGHTLEAQKRILKELKSEFGGAAAAQATLGEKAKTAFGNIEEKLGTALLPMVNKVERAFLRKGVPAINGFIDSFTKKGIPAIKHFADRAKPLAEEIIPALGTTLGVARDVLKEAAPYAEDLVGAFNDMPDWAKKGLALGGLGALAGKKLGLGSVIGSPFSKNGGGILGAFSKSTPLPVYVVNNGVPGVPGVPGTPGEKGAGSKVFGLVKDAAKVALPFLAKAPVLPALGSQVIDPGHIGSAADFARLKAGREELAKMAALAKTLPPQLITDVVLHGAPESLREARELAKQYDLTPKQKQTLFKTLGVANVQNQTTQLLKKYSLVSRPVSTSVSVSGASTAEAQLSRILTLINDVNRTHVVNQGIREAGGIAPQGAPSLPRTTAPRRPAQINIHLDGQKIGSVIDDRIYAHDDMTAERGRANR